METIDDIVREMREESDKGPNLYSPRHTIEAYIYIGLVSERIESALKRERAQHAAVLRAQIDEVQRAAVYKEALKPVLQVKVGDEDVIETARACMRACREAMRIWREGMEACK